MNAIQEGSSWMLLCTAFLLALILVENTVKSDCVFPGYFQDKEWFTHYVATPVDAGRYEYNPWRIVFYRDSATWSKYGSDGGIVDAYSYRCPDGGDDAQYFTNLLLSNDYDSDRRCMASLAGERSLFTRMPSLQAGQSSEYEVCPYMSRAVGARIFVQYPFDFSNTQCPWPSGQYRVTYREGSSSNEVTCVGTVEISGNTLHFETCSGKSSSYEQPFDATLRCVVTYEGRYLDYDSYGDIILLADMNDPPLFYCGRFTTVGSQTYLSLYVGHITVPNCPLGKRYDQTGNDYVLFTFSDQDMSPSTTSSSKSFPSRPSTDHHFSIPYFSQTTRPTFPTTRPTSTRGSRISDDTGFPALEVLIACLVAIAVFSVPVWLAVAISSKKLREQKEKKLHAAKEGTKGDKKKAKNDNQRNDIQKFKNSKGKSFIVVDKGNKDTVNSAHIF